MATIGEPLTGRHLVALYSSQVTKGTPVTPATSPGIVSFDVVNTADLRSIFGVGSPNALFLKPGINSVNWSINSAAIQTKAFLELAERASGILPYLTLGFGVDYDTGASWAWQVQDAKAGQLDVSLDAGGLLSGSISGIGGLITVVTTLASANLSEAPLMSYEGVMLKGGAAYPVRSFRMSVNHNLTADTIIPGTAPASFKRGWSYLTEGREEVTGELTTFDRSQINHQADTISDFTLLLTCTDIAAGGNAIAISVTGAKFGEERFAGDVDGLATFSTPFVGKAFTIS
jgi:hypothetical protein